MKIGMCVMLSVPFVANATVITIDNTDAGFSYSGFTNSTFESGFVGSNYMVDTVNSSGDFARWDPTGSSDWLAGMWKVEMNWTSGPSRATNALVTIEPGFGSLVVNQVLGGGTWTDFGTYNFSATGASVLIDDSNSTRGQYIIADAVRFTYVSQAPVTVPTPASLFLILIGVVGLAVSRRK